MRARGVFVSILALVWLMASAGVISCSASDPTEPPPTPCKLQIEIMDTMGNPLAARVRVACSDGRVRPDTLARARLV